MKTKKYIDSALGLPSAEEFAAMNIDTGTSDELYEDFDDEEEEIDFTISDVELARKNMAQLQEYRKQLKDIPDVTARKSHLDRLAKLAENKFEDMFDRAFNCEDRFAAEMLNAANAMLKIALDAHAKVIDSDIKLIDMQIKKDKIELDYNSKNKGVAPVEGVVSGEVVKMTRNQRIASRQSE